MAVRPRSIVFSLLLLTALTAAGIAASASAPTLPARHAAFLEEVAPLMTSAEREAFLALAKDYQRDAFIDRFWRARDPYPETARNELAEDWRDRVALARERYETLDDDRAQMLLLLGEPEDTVKASCFDLLRPLEIWYYSGAGPIRGSFSLVFIATAGASRGSHRLWYPSQGLYPLLVMGLGATAGDEQQLERIAAECVRGEEIATGLAAAVDWNRVEREGGVVPRPGDEWLQTFVAYSTDLPEGAATFPAELRLTFPGRHQSRTVLQGVVEVPLADLPGGDERGGEAVAFAMDGEILRRDELFEHFRYRFVLDPARAADGRLPLVFQRYLRPGPYRLIVKLEEVGSGSFHRRELDIEVPLAPVGGAAPHAVADSDGVAPAAGDAPDQPPPGPVAVGLAEANAALLQAGDTAIELLAPAPRLLTGRARFEAFVTGGAVAKVSFELDGKPVLAKTRPPYSVELDLGEQPRLHIVRAVALDAAERLLAADEVVINAGPHRFAVRLLEPQPGATYRDSLRARASVEVPEGEQLERLELYLGEELMATLYQPPFDHPVLLPDGEPVHYVRAVAYLADGNSTEDAVIINAPDYSDDLKVRFVELYTTVTDRRGRPVEGLGADDFTVFENGVEQEVRRFERVKDQPVYAGVLLDTSSSMAEELEAAVNGALTFFDSVLTPKDRAAVITFAQQPTLAVRFTNDRRVLTGSLQGLTAEGETALYDSLVYALYYFSGIPRKRALIVLSDGEDVGSRYTYEDVIDYARRTGVAIYTVGIKLGTRQSDIRLKLNRLAAETGGQSFYVEGATHLEKVYRDIEVELRSQYLLAYQSSAEGKDDRFREVRVEVAGERLEAKTMLGYYP